MISTASLQRFIAVFAVLLAFCYGEWLLLTHNQQWLPGLVGRTVTTAVGLGGLLFLSWITSWERRRRQEDEAAVQKVMEAARSVGVEIPEDRAILPVFFRGSVGRSDATAP